MLTLGEVAAHASVNTAGVVHELACAVAMTLLLYPLRARLVLKLGSKALRVGGVARVARPKPALLCSRRTANWGVKGERTRSFVHLDVAVHLASAPAFGSTGSSSMCSLARDGEGVKGGW